MHSGGKERFVGQQEEDLNVVIDRFSKVVHGPGMETAKKALV